jgi:hypothetical protein
LTLSFYFSLNLFSSFSLLFASPSAAAHFLMPERVWEMGAGCLLALRSRCKRNRLHSGRPPLDKVSLLSLLCYRILVRFGFCHQSLDNWRTFFELSLSPVDDRCVVPSQLSFVEQPLRMAVRVVANGATSLKDLLFAFLSAGFLFVLWGKSETGYSRERGRCVASNPLGVWLGGAWAGAEPQVGISDERI